MSRRIRPRAAARRFLAVVAALLGALLAGPPAAAAGPTTPLEIHTAAGKVHHFRVELAADDATRERGLMFRTRLAPDHGMLFDFGRTFTVHMWMKNTRIPLDMLFIRADGVIARIAADTVPFSEETVSSGNPVRYVLEVPGGTAARLGIRPGDRVRHAAIP